MFSTKPEPRILGELEEAPAVPSRLQPSSPPPMSVDGADPAPAKPSWYRPPNSKIRRVVGKILLLKFRGYDTEKIAKTLGTSASTVRNYLYLAGKNGWLTDDGELVDPHEQLAIGVAHKIVRNIDKSLDGEELPEQTFEMTKEAAKGIGLFKTHQVVKGEQMAQTTVVAIRVEMPTIDGKVIEQPEPPEDMLGGVPAFIEGEVEDGQA